MLLYFIKIIAIENSNMSVRTMPPLLSCSKIVLVFVLLVYPNTLLPTLASNIHMKQSFLSHPSESVSTNSSSSSSLFSLYSRNLSREAWNLSWIAGIEYTPAMAPGNSLWWWRWPEYAEEVAKELELASRHFGFNFLRMFLHPLVYDGVEGNDGGRILFAALSDFLDVAFRFGFKVSFAFFDDCWNHAGASLVTPCVPIKGRHNGCWMASPQDNERTNVSRFRPYVYNTVLRFANDSRIVFWEIYNEPQNSNQFSMQLRDAAYGWAVQALEDALVPSGTIPILSCWDDNKDTQVVDMHRYDTDFSGWTKQVFQNPSKGALITEGGSRWYQGYDSDAGSPLTVLHWFNHLRSITPSPNAPFPFGMVTNWELMVGNSNTRWHWNTLDNSREPVMPWDGYLFPDGTPVSYTEAAVVRNWTKRVNDLLAFDKFLPNTHLFNGDSYLCLQAGDVYTANLVKGIDGSRILVETTVWPSATSGGGILIRASSSSSSSLSTSSVPSSSSLSLSLSLSSSSHLSGYFAGWRNTSQLHPMLVLEEWRAGVETILATFDMSTLDCGLASNGWNMLRVVAEGPMLSVYANPMFPEAASTAGIQPRISFNLEQQDFFRTGGVKLISVGEQDSPGSCTRFDYVGVLDPEIL